MSESEKTIQEECYGTCWGAQQRIDDLTQQLNSANECIKRLKEALEATAKVIGPPGKSTWVSDDELNHAWELYLKAKEVNS